MMHAILLAVVWLIQTAVQYSIVAILIALVAFGIVGAGRWLLGHPDADGYLSQNRA